MSLYKDSISRQASGLTGPIWSPVRIDVLKKEFGDHVGIVALAVDPTTPDTLYASTEIIKTTSLDRGFIKSTDGGVTWTDIKNGMRRSLIVLCIAIDPKVTNTVYAGTADGGLYKSINGGSSWAPMSTGMNAKGEVSHLTINALAIDPQNTTTIYAATEALGIYKSTNAGESWIQLNNGLTDGKDSLTAKISALAVAIDPTNPQIIYAATTGKGVFKSTDGGQSWTDTFLRLKKESLSIIPFAAEPGNTISVMTLTINPKHPTTIYAGTAGSGVYKSSNGGGTWVPVNRGLGSSNTKVRILIIDSENPDSIYGGTQRGVIRSFDGGQNWEFINFGLQLLPNLDHPYALALDSLHPHTMYVGTTLLGVYRSSNITAVE